MKLLVKAAKAGFFFVLSQGSIISFHHVSVRWRDAGMEDSLGRGGRAQVGPRRPAKKDRPAVGGVLLGFFGGDKVDWGGGCGK